MVVVVVVVVVAAVATNKPKRNGCSTESSPALSQMQYVVIPSCSHCPSDTHNSMP